MSVEHTWTSLSAFERDCFDVCCRLNCTTSTSPTHAQIFEGLCERYQTPLNSEQVSTALLELFHRSLITQQQLDSETAVFSPSADGRTLLRRRHQALTELVTHRNTTETGGEE